MKNKKIPIVIGTSLTLLSVVTIPPIVTVVNSNKQSNRINNDNQVNNDNPNQNDNNNQIVDNNNSSSNNSDSIQDLNSQEYEDKYFGVDYSLTTNETKQLNDTHQKINNLKSKLNQKNNDFDVFGELSKSLKVVNDAFEKRQELIDKIATEVSNNNISFLEGVNEFNKYILDKNWTTDKWYAVMDIDKERFIAESRYSKSFNESSIKTLTYEMDRKWLFKDVGTEYNRIARFFKTFGFLDLLKEYNYELLSIPYLYQSANQKSYHEGIWQLNGKEKYENDAIVFLYRIEKDINLIAKNLNWYNISPTTQNSAWYKWILYNNKSFEDAFKISGIKLEEDLSTSNVSDWDGKVSTKPESKYWQSSLPSNLKNASINEVDKYIKNKILDIETMPQDKAFDELKDVFNRICYGVEYNAYKQNYYMTPLMHENNISEVVKAFNLSLFNDDFAIKSDAEILNARIDYQKIYSAMYVGNDPINGGSALSIEEALEEIKYLKDNYYIQTTNFGRINFFNDIIRKIDSFKNLYYEFSIMPYLFNRVVGMKYCEWNRDMNCWKDPKYGFLYKKWMVEQYITYRDWILFKEKYWDKTPYQSLKPFEETTQNSGWFNWINKIDFKINWFQFTAVPSI